MIKRSQFLSSILVSLLATSLLLAVTDSNAALFKRSKYFDKDELPRESRVPGGVALISFKHRDNPPEAYFYGNRVMVLQTGRKKWVAVIGLPLKIEAGQHDLIINDKKGEHILPFTVSGKEYEAQYITLQNRAQVSPGKAALARIKEESRIMNTAYKAWEPEPPTQLKMDYPVEGPLSSQFGLKRFFNNQARNPHSGLDIAAPRGSVISTPLAGKVSAVGDYYFNGHTVLIDHGQGLVSMYCHLDSTSVKNGQILAAGENIGTVGSSGRATGPHLHWTLSLNNSRVDPSLFVRDKNK